MQKISVIAGRLRHQLRHRGVLATVRFILGRLFRRHTTCVYAADLRQPRAPVDWRQGERFVVIGSETALTPAVRRFLGGAAYECEAGLRAGDRLFLVADCDEYLHRGYVTFGGRPHRLLGEADGTPMVGYCYTADSARGRGIYRRALLAELAYLQQSGHKRAVIDAHPENQASRKGIESAGFRLERTVCAWIVLNSFAVQRTAASQHTRWRALFL